MMAESMSQMVSTVPIEQEKMQSALMLPGVKSKSDPFYSPAQLSDISTVADWCSEPEEDGLEWETDELESDAEDDLDKNFPTLQAFFHKKEPVSRQVEQWNAVGERLSLTLSSCKVESDNEDLPGTPTLRESMKCWSLVGIRLSSVFANAAEEDEDVF